MKIRYSYRNTGPYTYKECHCTLTLPADEMLALLMDANCGLAQFATVGGDVAAKDGSYFRARRLAVLALIQEVEARRDRAREIPKDESLR